MTYITMGQAEQIVPVARSTFRKHAKAGKFSTSKNARDLQIVDIAELERYYEKLKPFPDDIQSVQENGHIENEETQEIDGNRQYDTSETQKVEQNGQPETPQIDGDRQVGTTAQTQEIIDLLKAQLEESKERETKLLSMLSEQQKLLAEEQQRTKMLMPPPDEQPAKKKPSIFGYFRLKR